MRSRGFRAVVATLTAAVAVVVAAESARAGLLVSESSLVLSADERVGTVTVVNKDLTEKVVQISAKAWTQADGEDRFGPTPDMIVVPRVVKMAPGGTQTVRVGFRGTIDPARESDYRLFVSEVPSKILSAGAVNLAFTLSIPIFVQPKFRSEPKLTWTFARAPKDRVAISVTNAGTAHAKISDLEIFGPSPQSPLVDGLFERYVLPGSTATETMPVRGGLPSTFAFKARVNGTFVDGNAAVGKP
jgi:fimbrial chaperone protein